MKKINLNENWQYRIASNSGAQTRLEGAWKKANVPGNIHLDLLANKEIPDPYYRLNEKQQQWIGEADWEYYSRFYFDGEDIEREHIDIVFEGLDTYADVYLNNVLILEADNMYTAWRADLKPQIRSGLNQLKIYFHSVIKKTFPLFEKNGFEYGANNSQEEPKLSVYSRKPGYHFGWDWGPRLLTCGIWRPVYIEVWDDVRLDNVYFVQKTLTDKLAKLSLEVEIISSTYTDVDITLTNNGSAFSPVKKNEKLVPGVNKIIVNFEIKNPIKWWCNGLGDAHLYELNLDVAHGNSSAGSWNERVGLRTIQLVNEEDENGKSFYFKINNVQVFIKGANFLPADYFIPRIKKEDNYKLLKDAVDSNMNMLRIWGGAIYEEKIFYNLCDEMGIMIWQDFMFACAMYPADDVMAKRIRQEAEYNVMRLRNHSCLAIWCGNNEIDEGWHTWGWQERYNYSEETNELLWNYYRKIFHEILPAAVKNLDPEKPYWSSSPKFSFKDSRSKNDGDMHYWGVWFQNHPREKFKEYVPRFMSEYGLQSMPDVKTFLKFSLPEDWELQSEVMQAHQRQYPNPKRGQKFGGFGIMQNYLKDEYHIPEDFELLAYASQILQADYLRYAIETHRRNKPYCMGTMYWQLNDVWPVISWSTIDYYGRWKAAHYAVRNAYSPVLVSTSEEKGLLNVFIISDLLELKRASLSLQLINFDGEILFQKNIDVVISENSSKIYFSIDRKNLVKNKDTAKLVWLARLKSNNELLSENMFYFNYLKNLKLEKPGIYYSVEEKDEGYFIKLNAKKLAKNVKIEIYEPYGFLSDNYFDLIPGRGKIIIFKTKDNWNKQLKILYYNMISKS